MGSVVGKLATSALPVMISSPLHACGPISTPLKPMPVWISSAGNQEATYAGGASAIDWVDC